MTSLKRTLQIRPSTTLYSVCTEEHYCKSRRTHSYIYSHVPRHLCVPSCLVTHLSEAGWRRPVRRSLSHDILGCMASRLSTRCRCQPGNNFRQFQHEACINGSLPSGISAGGCVDDARTLSPSRPCPCHGSREARRSVSPYGVFYESSVQSFRESLEHRLLPNTLFLRD